MFRVKFDRLKLARDRRGVMAIMFALALIPLIIAVSLAIDYGFAIQARAQLNLAADAAAMHAVRVASQSLTGGATVTQSTNAGIAAGQQWFAAQVGNLNTASVPTNNVNVSVTYTPSPGAFSANVSYSGTIQTQLGLTAILPTSWSISGSASALVSNSYLEVLMMLDNSSSMQIGASPTDIQRLMALTACSSVGAWYKANVDDYMTQSISEVGDPYQLYMCGFNGNNYPTGALPSCPLHVTKPPFSTAILTPVNNPFPVNFYLPSQAAQIPTCPLLGSTPSNPIYAGAPCAFACHFDTTKPPGTGFDYYGLARSTVGTATPITLRFDVLKSAVNTLLQTMEKSTALGANLSVGIYAFNTSLTEVYPTSGEAGTDFTAAISAVGTPPTKASQPDTGIQPETLVGNAFHSDTAFNATMQQLASQVTPSGNGLTAASPRKILFIITDGSQNSCANPDGCPQIIDTTQCQAFKNLGFSVYVIYTTYYPLMHVAYFANNIFPITQGTGPGTIPYALQQCATNADDYIEAADLTTMTNALELFLDTALNGPGRITN